MCKFHFTARKRVGMAETRETYRRTLCHSTFLRAVGTRWRQHEKRSSADLRRKHSNVPRAVRHCEDITQRGPWILRNAKWSRDDAHRGTSSDRARTTKCRGANGRGPIWGDGGERAVRPGVEVMWSERCVAARTVGVQQLTRCPRNNNRRRRARFTFIDFTLLPRLAFLEKCDSTATMRSKPCS